MWVEINSEILHAPMVEGDEYLGGVGSNHQRMAIQWVHRLGALGVIVMFLFLAYHCKTHTRALMLVLAMLSIQIALGILNAVWLLPLSLALLHNTFAMLLLLSALNGLTRPELEEDSQQIAQELLA
jgi:cytochrome c oxidase assembly protein subunit 15